MTQAVLIFPSHCTAKDFAINWTRATLTGHTIGAVKQDKSVSVTIYNIDTAKKAWINNYINKLNIAKDK